MNQSRLYRRAFALLGGFTPLRADCGALCEKRCCGGDAETGMLLFPGEKTSLPVKTVGGRTLVVCGGVCDRDARPLACRLFPLFPVPDGHGGLKAAPDVRGGLCPLVQHAEDVAFSPRFCARVAAVGRLLLRDESCRVFLQQVWDEMDEAREVEKIFKTT